MACVSNEIKNRHIRYRNIAINRDSANPLPVLMLPYCLLHPLKNVSEIWNKIRDQKNMKMQSLLRLEMSPAKWLPFVGISMWWKFHHWFPDLVYYQRPNKASANETRRHICKVLPHRLMHCSVIDIKGLRSIHAVKLNNQQSLCTLVLNVMVIFHVPDHEWRN